MPLGSTFEIGTQIILLKIDGFLKGWILNITPLNVPNGNMAGQDSATLGGAKIGGHYK